jgi:hypothetical protein
MRIRKHSSPHEVFVFHRWPFHAPDRRIIDLLTASEIGIVVDVQNVLTT